MDTLEEHRRKAALRGPRHCQWCAYWGGPINPADPDGNIWCLKAKQVEAIPAEGCAYWTRAPGPGEEAPAPPAPYGVLGTQFGEIPQTFVPIVNRPPSARS